MPPALTSLSPNTGAVGATVTITGTTFSSLQSTSTVSFNGTLATATAWSNTSITVTVPTGATTGNVTVTVAGNTSNALTFTVTSGAYYTGTLFSPTCNFNNIQSAINSAAELDMVRWPASCTIPSGTFTIVGKGIYFDCNGGSFGGALSLDSSGATKIPRVTNCTFTNDGCASVVSGCTSEGTDAVVFVHGGSVTSPRWRLDHNHWTGTQNVLTDFAYTPGLVDHNTWDHGGASKEIIHFLGVSTITGNCSADASQGWTYTIPQSSGSRANGTDESIMFEDNTLAAGSAGQANPPFLESFYGAIVNYRFNQFTYVSTDAHGNNCSGGTRWWEYIDNTFTNTNTAGANFNVTLMNLRAGSGVIVGNLNAGNGTANGVFVYVKMGQENLAGESTVYPSQDQIGRGACSANPCTWGAGSNSALDPAYYVLNDHAFTGVSLNDCDCVNPFPMMLTFNIDAYSDVQSASCTAGGSCTTGVGSGATLPTSCTPGVAFWKTNESSWNTKLAANTSGRLYKCAPSPPNTWAVYYTPYTYPDPLQTSLTPSQ